MSEGPDFENGEIVGSESAEHEHEIKPSLDFENSSAVGSRDSIAALLTSTKTSEDFDFDALDSDEDSIRQMLKDGWSANKIINSFSYELIEREVAKRLAVIVALVQRHERPMLFIDQLCWHSGVAIANGQSLVSMAEKYGMTKQGFRQHTARAMDKIKLRKTRTQRSEKAKANMSKAYTKPNKRDLKIPFLEL
jgi:DNA-directed RNA polymerase sigma subunit (sigma70/sigma32)